jgi:ribosomal protein S14
MKALIKKNKLIRNDYKKLELNSYIYSALTKNLLTLSHSPSPVGKLDKSLDTINLPYISKIRNICVLTGRSRAINNTYKLSRLKFKKLAETGYLYGINKI